MAARKDVAKKSRVVARTRSTRRSSPGAVEVLSRDKNRCGSTVKRKSNPRKRVQSYGYSTGGDRKEQADLALSGKQCGARNQPLARKSRTRTVVVWPLARAKSRGVSPSSVLQKWGPDNNRASTTS